MANADKNFDEYFKNKLSTHEVKPSGLAWERLDQKISEQNRKTGYPFLKIAATILLLISAGFVFYTLNLGEKENTNQLAVREVLVQDNLQDVAPEIIEPHADLKSEDSDNMELNEITTKPIQSKAQIKTETSSPELVAEASKPIKAIQTENIELPEIAIPELDIHEAIALNNANAAEEEEEIAYKVTIISRGIKEEPAKQNLLEEIEEKVDKIGGLFSKVEQGFADLQDAKNNLFANSNPRKERSR